MKKLKVQIDKIKNENGDISYQIYYYNKKEKEKATNSKLKYLYVPMASRELTTMESTRNYE